MIDKRLHFSKRKIILTAILLLTGVILWIISIINQMHISGYHDGVSVRFREPLLNKQRVDDILEAMILREDNNIPEITLWQRDEHIEITNEGEDKTIEISLITVVGDMSRIYPVAMVNGGYLSVEDNYGCIIDRATAFRMFGNSNALGLKLNYNDKEYIIRGVMKEIGTNVMIIQEESGPYKITSPKKFSCMELSYTDVENAKLRAEEFVLTNGLGTADQYIDGYLSQRLSYMLIHIPLWFIALLIIIYAAREVYLLKASPKFTIVGVIGIIILGMLLIKVTNMHFYYPSSMIPNRWSDFSFWADKWKEIVSSISRKEGTILYYKDIMLRKRMLIVVIGVATAVITEFHIMVAATLPAVPTRRHKKKEK